MDIGQQRILHKQNDATLTPMWMFCSHSTAGVPDVVSEYDHGGVGDVFPSKRGLNLLRPMCQVRFRAVEVQRHTRGCSHHSHRMVSSCWQLGGCITQWQCICDGLVSDQPLYNSHIASVMDPGFILETTFIVFLHTHSFSTPSEKITPCVYLTQNSERCTSKLCIRKIMMQIDSGMIEGEAIGDLHCSMQFLSAFLIVLLLYCRF